MKCAVKVLAAIVVGVVAFLNNAYARVALAQIRFKVVDQDGVVVPDAKVWGGFTCGGGMNDYVLVDGLTNSNGEFVAQGNCNEFLRVDVTKDGYYRSEEKVFFWRTKSDPKVKDGKWQPYGETRTVVLKKIKKPGALRVPSFLVRVESTIPAYGEWIPFDLEKFDWTAPYGVGVHDDVLLLFRRRDTGRWNDFTYEMDVSFTNHPYAGVVKMEKDCSSDFVTAYNADPSANYISSFNYILERTGRGGSRMSVLEKDSYLIFRTRTSVDEKGRLKAAHYGTILGEWAPGKTYMSFADGCFNPILNDTNIEDGHQLREKLREAKWKLDMPER